MNLLTTILSFYLTVVTTLANLIAPAPVLELTAEDPSLSSASPTELAIDSLPSRYEYGGSIPDILLKNAELQPAAVAHSSDLDSVATSSSDFSDAIVNIYCTYKTPTFTRTTTGSGFFVTDTGVILTNAHVGMFLLLDGTKQNADIECQARTGDIATAAYTVDLLYISPAWIQENADIIREAEPRGTGERDYALLYVTDSATDTELPEQFPFVHVDTNLLPLSTKGKTVTLGGYPAIHILTDGPEAPIKKVLATSSVAKLFTFGSNYADIFYLTGSPVGEHGSSGGPVLASNGSVIGLISTKSDDSILGTGSLSAITLSYIDRTMREETTFGFTENTQGNLSYRSQLFKETVAPFLTRILEGNL